MLRFVPAMLALLALPAAAADPDVTLQITGIGPSGTKLVDESGHA